MEKGSISEACLASVSLFRIWGLWGFLPVRAGSPSTRTACPSCVFDVRPFGKRMTQSILGLPLRKV
eukprot:2723433-Amphidinium_carterae.1